jgi:hypothetical protein
MSEICEEVIHYPSEDYPCLCERLVLDDSGKVCLECEHDARKHSFSTPQRGEGAEGG